MKHFLKNYNKIFFIGIGGCSMSALALLCKKKGKIVLGSDISKSEYLKNLKREGIKIYYKHIGTNVRNCDLVVYSGAISEQNEELIYAKTNKIPIMERSKFLSMVSRYYKLIIAVAGTHGKTTVSAMLGYIFILAGLNPTIHVGGFSQQLGGNIYIGGNDIFITEACEFRDSFLTLSPHYAIINNLEEEHLDYFKTYEKEIISFNKFANKVKKNCLINGKYELLFKDSGKNIFFNKINDLFIKNISIDNDGKYSFDCYFNKLFYEHFSLNIEGKHNLQNALAVIRICYLLNIKRQVIKIGLNTFENVGRRFEKLGEFNGNIVIQDYAHHPTEILYAIRSCREKYKGKQIVCFFQPHTYSRTIYLLDKFLTCFNGVSSLYLLETFRARENEQYKGSAKFLKDKLEKNNTPYKIYGVFSLENMYKKIRENLFQNSVLLFLGAGNIKDLAKKIIK